MNHFYYPEYGFLFEEDSEFVPGIGDMVTILGPGEELAKQREALGLTQQQVADRARINIRQYQRLESGERSLDSTSFRIGLNVCHALQIDPRFYCEVRHREKIQQAGEQNLQNVTAGEEGHHVVEEGSLHKGVPRRQFKYVTYREGDDGAPGEIIGVAYGAGIHDVFDQVSRSIRDELSAEPDYAGCSIDIYPYDRLENHRYSVQSVVHLPCAPENALYTFLVVESEKE